MLAIVAITIINRNLVHQLKNVRLIVDLAKLLQNTKILRNKKANLGTKLTKLCSYKSAWPRLNRDLDCLHWTVQYKSAVKVVEVLATDDDDRSKGNGPSFVFRMDPNAADIIRASFKVEHDPSRLLFFLHFPPVILFGSLFDCYSSRSTFSSKVFFLLLPLFFVFHCVLYVFLPIPFLGVYEYTVINAFTVRWDGPEISAVFRTKHELWNDKKTKYMKENVKKRIYKRKINFKW
jgi:hypothetical protein